MKTYVKMLAVLLIAGTLTMTSCSKNTPKEVAYNWLTAFNHLDFETARKLSTPDTKVLLGELDQLTSKVSDSNKKDLKKVTVNIKKVKEDGDKATVTYVSSDDASKEQTVTLVKQEGKWLVQFTKVDLMGGLPQKDEDMHEGADASAQTDTVGTAPADTARH